jgi:hypothetical protein
MGLLKESVVDVEEVEDSVEAEVAEVADTQLSVEEERAVCWWVGATEVSRHSRDLIRTSL